MRQVTIKIPEVADILPRADLLKGWRTTIVNGTAVLFGTAATVAPDMLLPSPAWLTHSQAAGLFVVILGAANMGLRAITTTPLGMSQERERVITKRVIVAAPPAPVDFWAAREEIAELGDVVPMPDLSAPYRDSEPDKPSFGLPVSPATNAMIGFIASAPVWFGACAAWRLL